MPQFTKKYVNYTRKHQFDDPEATFLKDIGYSFEQAPDTTIDILILDHGDFGPPFPMTERSQLVFAKVEGSPGGDYIISNFGVYQIKIGTEDVVVTSYYATFFDLYFGNDNEPSTALYYAPDINILPGFYIDAFNIDNMTWLEGGFVNIYSQGVLETSATNNANKLGLFLTNFPATLQAVNEIGQAKFLKWIVVHPYKTEAVSSSVVQLKEASNGFVFAFYTNEDEIDPANKPKFIFPREVGPVRITPGVAVDGGGFAIGPGGRPHPVGPWGPLNKQVLQLNLLIKAAENTPNEVTERTRVKLLNQLESLMQLVRELGRK